MSIGGSKNKGSNSSNSYSQSWDYGTNVWGAQSPYLQDLFNRANDAMNANQFGDQSTSNLFNAGQANLAAGAGALERSNSALESMLNPQMDPMLGVYAKTLGQQFNEQFLPGLQGDAALAGGLGGSRQQIGGALGAQRAMQTLSDFGAQTYAAGQDRALAAAQGLGANAATMQNSAGMYAQLADFARSMPWYSLGQYQGLLGPAITQDLGSYSTSSSTSKGSTSGGSFNFGLGGG